MEWYEQLKDQIPSIAEIIRWGGLGALFLIIFIETGLLFPFLPGDSLLVTAGLFAAKGDLNIFTLNILLIIAAVTGDSVAYYLGHKMGKNLYRRKDSWFFKREHLERTREFYEKHGGKTIIIARFVPIVRTFAPVVAGIGAMDYKRFISYNVFGGIFWVVSMTMTGYLLVRAFPATEEHIEKVILLVIFLSIVPGIVAFIRAKMAPNVPTDPKAEV